MFQSNSYNALRAGIIGATGYAGIELASLLSGHPNFELACLGSKSAAGKTLDEFYHQLPPSLGEKPLVSIDEFLATPLDIAFLAVPHTTAFDLVAALLKQGTKVVDLSADFRLQDSSTYSAFYHVNHAHPELLGQAVYGLSEFARDHLAGAQLVANPGCYPTASALACLPAVQAGIVDTTKPIVISAVSGFSGAGKKACETLSYSIANEFVAPYKPLTHQHTPEIEQTFSLASQEGAIKVLFVPHIASFKRGILASCFIPLKKVVVATDVASAFASSYDHEPFITVLEQGALPRTSAVSGTNKADIAWEFDENSHVLYVACAIDNLIKGAAGQALQNANIMFGFDETCGLTSKKEVI